MTAQAASQPDRQETLTDDFRKAMRQLAATPTIVSTASAGKRFGMAATAVSSLSVDPPSLLICVNQSASIHPALPTGNRFCINILDAKHEDICMAFGGAVEASRRFETSAWTETSDDVPYLLDANANVFCEVSRVIDHASHSIIIGSVYDCMVAQPGIPLIYGNGGFLKAC